MLTHQSIQSNGTFDRSGGLYVCKLEQEVMSFREFGIALAGDLCFNHRLNLARATHTSTSKNA